MIVSEPDETSILKSIIEMTNGIHLPSNDGSVQGVETVVSSGFRGEMKDNHLVGTIDKRSII